MISISANEPGCEARMAMASWTSVMAGTFSSPSCASAADADPTRRKPPRTTAARIRARIHLPDLGTRQDLPPLDELALVDLAASVTLIEDGLRRSIVRPRFIGR